MSEPYKSISVGVCRQIARDFDKSIVIICAWDPVHSKLHTTTYGVHPNDKISAARGGDICAKALGMDINKKNPNEDFRTIDAARNAQIRDIVSRNLGRLKQLDALLARELEAAL